MTVTAEGLDEAEALAAVLDVLAAGMEPEDKARG